MNNIKLIPHNELTNNPIKLNNLPNFINQCNSFKNHMDLMTELVLSNVGIDEEYLNSDIPKGHIIKLKDLI